MDTIYTGPPCPVCGFYTDDEGETGQIGTFLTVCMNIQCHHFGRYVEVNRQTTWVEQPNPRDYL
jgi:hypothetical protein